MRAVIDGKGIGGGRIIAPPSKSYSHRAILVASLSDGVSKISNILVSDDIESSIRGVKALGADVSRSDRVLEINGFGGCPEPPGDVVDLGNSGTSLRFLVGVSSLLREGAVVFTGDESLRDRPNGILLEAINSLGGEAFSTKNDGKLPIVVKGRIEGGKVCVEGSVSSQFISSLLLTLPNCDEDSFVEPVLPIKSEPYIDMTIELLKESNVKISNKYKISGNQCFSPLIDYRVPGDYSSSANMLVLGAISNKIEVCGLNFPSIQADYEILSILENAGASLLQSKRGIVVEPSDLSSFDVDLSDNPDLFPILVVLGCFVQGEVRLRNISHVRYKETDRVEVMEEEITKMSVDVEIDGDDFVVYGCDPDAADLDGHGDHRIVMALTVAALNAEGTSKISDVESVNVSYPNFFDHIKEIGGDVSFRE